MGLAPSDWINLGILVSVVFGLILAINELREAGRQRKIEIYSTYTERYAEIIAKFPDTINETDFEIQSLSKEKRDETMRAMRQYFDLSYEEYSLYEKYHLIEGEVWQDWKEGIEYALSKKAFRDAWAVIKLDTKFTKSGKFESYIDRCADFVESPQSSGNNPNPRESSASSGSRGKPGAGVLYLIIVLLVIPITAVFLFYFAFPPLTITSTNSQVVAGTLQTLIQFDGVILGLFGVVFGVAISPLGKNRDRRYRLGLAGAMLVVTMVILLAVVYAFGEALSTVVGSTIYFWVPLALSLSGALMFLISVMGFTYLQPASDV